MIKKKIDKPSGTYSAITKDGKLIAIGSPYTNTITILGGPSGDTIKSIIVNEKEISAMSFLPDETKIAVGMNNGNIYIWDYETNQLVQTYSGQNSYISSVTFSSNGTLMVSGSADGRIKLWEVSTAQNVKTLTGHTSVIDDILFTSDDKLIITSSEDQTIRIWGLFP